MTQNYRITVHTAHGSNATRTFYAETCREAFNTALRQYLNQDGFVGVRLEGMHSAGTYIIMDELGISLFFSAWLSFNDIDATEEQARLANGG